MSAVAGTGGQSGPRRRGGRHLMVEQSGGGRSEPGAARRLGDFTLLRLLGKGSQGEVWEARQESLGRAVALKILPPQLTFSEERLQRFQREAEAGGRLSHAGIVTVHAIGEHQGVHFIAQELVPGGRTLADVLDEARRLPELPADWHDRMTDLFAQVAEALHAAHEVGVVHRDVKPGNILLTQDGRPKVADFGLALVQDELSLSHTGDLAGTPYYMSPEQVSGARAGLDHRTDIFSLGSSLYEALTLNRPFTGDRQQIMEGILQRDPPDPRRAHRHVPRDLAVICLKALEKPPVRRFATAGAMAADLRRVLAGEAIHARPPGPLVRAGKWAHRHPRVSAAGTVAAVSFAVVVWLLRENVQKKVEAWDANQRLQAASAEERAARERAATAYENERAARERTALALAEAEDARLAAQAESRQNERVVSLLEDVFSGPDPLTLTAEESVQSPQVLNRGAASVALLDDQPAAQWRLVLRLGRGYRNLGLDEEADRQLRRALDLARRTFGERDARTATSLLELAREQHQIGDYAEAESGARQALDVLAFTHGAASIEALAAVGELGGIAKDAGRLDEAERRLREYHAGCTQAGAGGSHQVLASHALGQFLLEQGRLDEAAGYLRPAYERADELPEYHALQLRHAVASLDDLQGRRATRGGAAAEAARLDAEAEGLFLAVLERERALLGDGNADTLTTIDHLGNYYRERDRFDLARPLLEEAVARRTERAGPAAAATLYARNNLARMEHSAGNVAQAEAIWNDIVAIDRQDPQADVHPVLAALSNLASVARDDGRLELAESWAREAVERTPSGEPERVPREAKLAGILKALAAAQAELRPQP